MKKMSLLLAALLLSACEKPMPFESAEALAENPKCRYAVGDGQSRIHGA